MPADGFVNVEWLCKLDGLLGVERDLRDWVAW